MKLKKALAQRIKSLRDAAGLSQQDVAVRGDLSLSLVAKLEQGKKADPRASTLLALAQALGVKPGQLLDDLFPPTEAPPAPAVETAVGNHDAVVNGQEEKKEKKKGKKKKS
jgi:transcriptional regulator with XRE-family HTH domain